MCTNCWHTTGFTPCEVIHRRRVLHYALEPRLLEPDDPVLLLLNFFPKYRVSMNSVLEMFMTACILSVSFLLSPIASNILRNASRRSLWIRWYIWTDWNLDRNKKRSWFFWTAKIRLFDEIFENLFLANTTALTRHNNEKKWRHTPGRWTFQRVHP